MDRLVEMAGPLSYLSTSNLLGSRATGRILVSLGCLAWVQMPTQLSTAIMVFRTQGEASMGAPSVGGR